MRFLLCILLCFMLFLNSCSSTKLNENEQHQDNNVGEAAVVQSCTPHETKLKDCNRCKCSPNGRWMCTKKRCLPVERIEPRQSSLTSDGCVPGTRFKSECNHCICTSTGVPVCTLKGCGVVRPLIPIINNNNIIDAGLVVRSRRQLSNQERIFSLQELNNPDFTCTPNYSFKVECNTCWCSADGKRPRFCTRIACKNSNNNNVYPTLAPLPPPTEKTLNVE